MLYTSGIHSEKHNKTKKNRDLDKVHLYNCYIQSSWWHQERRVQCLRQATCIHSISISTGPRCLLELFPAVTGWVQGNTSKLVTGSHRIDKQTHANIHTHTQANDIPRVRWLTRVTGPWKSVLAQSLQWKQAVAAIQNKSWLNLPLQFPSSERHIHAVDKMHVWSGEKQETTGLLIVLIPAGHRVKPRSLNSTVDYLSFAKPCVMIAPVKMLIFPAKPATCLSLFCFCFIFLIFSKLRTVPCPLWAGRSSDWCFTATTWPDAASRQSVSLPGCLQSKAVPCPWRKITAIDFVCHVWKKIYNLHIYWKLN